MITVYDGRHHHFTVLKTIPEQTRATMPNSVEVLLADKESDAASWKKWCAWAKSTLPQCMSVCAYVSVCVYVCACVFVCLYRMVPSRVAWRRSVLSRGGLWCQLV